MIADASIGDIVEVRITSDRVRILKLIEIKTHGIEGRDILSLNLNKVFIPFVNILEIKKQNNT